MPDPEHSDAPQDAATWYGDRPPVLGDFEIQDLIGHGAMGAVFKARQRSMDRIVAVKILRPRLARNPEYVRRFFQEARAAARLNHPNIVLAIGVGEDHGLYYFAMERVEGHTAKLLLKAGTFEEARGLEIARQVALALDYAWTQEHIVHRDVKPANIIITPKGSVKLADLGLAHDPDLVEQGAQTTKGGIMGTPLYIAPEQIRRQPDLDVRCDLYALGATLFHIVTGRPPFEGGDSKSVMARHLSAPVPDPREIRPDLSEGFARIVTRLMAKDRDERYPDAQALVADIDELLAPPRDHAASTHIHPIRRRRIRRRRSLARRALAAALILAVLGAGALAISALARHRTRRPPDTRQAHEPPPPAPVDTAAMRAYDAALTFLEANRGNYLASLPRLRAVEDAYPGTKQARYAAERRRELEHELNGKARQALEQIRQRASNLAGQARYAQALAAFQTFPKSLATESWMQQIAKARETLERDARRRFNATLRDADRLADLGHLAEAIDAYEKLLLVAPTTWREAVATPLAAAREEQKEAEGQAEAIQWKLAYAALKERLPGLYHERRYEDAVRLIKSVLALAAPDRQPHLKRELDEAARLVDWWLAAEAGVAQRVEKPAQLRGVRGTITAFKEGVITFRKDGGEVVAEPLSKLSAADIIRFARITLPPEEAPLATARFLIAEGYLEPAEAALKKLEDAGTDVAGLRTRLQLVARRDPLDAAQAELGTLREALAGEKPQEAVAALRAFLERHQDTPGATALVLEAQTLLLNATRPKPTYAPDAKPAILRVACHGTCEVFLNGHTVAQTVFRPGKFDSFELRVKEGDVLAVRASGEPGSRGFYAMLLIEDGLYALTTDPAWRWCREPPEDWHTAPKPGGKWEAALPVYAPHAKAGYAEAAKGLEGYWIWGRGSTCYFRRTVRLAKTLAQRAAEQHARQKSLTGKYGAPVQATVALACRNAYRLYHNGRLVGCAASFNPEGTTYELRLRHGDVLGVHAYNLPAQEGWLDVKITLNGGKRTIRSDRTWAYTTHPPPEDWHLRGRPAGRWNAPYFYDAESFRIRADATSLYFRKTIDLKNGARRQGLAGLLHGRVRLSGTRAEVTYDFKDPAQLADWVSTGTWAWRKGRVGSTGGSFSTGPYNMRDIRVEAEVEIGGRLTIRLDGGQARRGEPDAAYELRFTNTRRGDVYLRKRGNSLAYGRLPASRAGSRLIIFKKLGPTFTVWVDKRKILSAVDDEPIPADQLWRVSFSALTDERTVIRGVRIIARPDWEALREELAGRHDRPTGEAAEALPRQDAPDPAPPPRPGKRPRKRRRPRDG